MIRTLLLSTILLIFFHATYARNYGDSTSLPIEWTRYTDSVKATMTYQTGTVTLPDGYARLNIPSKFKFLDAKQSKFVIEELWGNLPQEGILGTLFPADADPFTENSFVFVISYDAMGYVKDDDVESIDYDEILKGMKEDQVETNKQRQAAGIQTMNIVGWASKPYYDKTNKTLHWAKNLQVEGSDDNTLNYTVMVLGRKGILNLNAVASMTELEEVKKVIPEVLLIPQFTDGNTYNDFNPDVDEVAAWTIGGLVAGKVLAKAGILVFLLKFWKLLLLGIVGIGAFIKKMLGRNKKDEPEQPWPVDEATTATELPAQEEVKA